MSRKLYTQFGEPFTGATIVGFVFNVVVKTRCQRAL
jgi:hypothetical protein